jgi:CRP/FNR family transcriptional regulator, cyclic AMP receptor protein
METLAVLAKAQLADGGITRHLPRSFASGTASLLDLDPDFGRLLAAEERPTAARALIVRTIRLQKGTWCDDLTSETLLALLIAEGAIIRRVFAGRARSAEVLTDGDLVRPWQEDPTSFVDSEYLALKPTLVAVLDHHTRDALVRWPAIFDCLLERGIRRARVLGAQSALDNCVKVERRVLLCLWQLAERCGSATPEGVVLPISLTHQYIADMVRAQRPSVTTALSRLNASGTVRRTTDGGWILDPESAETLPGFEA